MIKSLYSKYFQKSKSFLYPALGIKKNSKYLPTGTYISVEGYIGAEEVKFVCIFDKTTTDEYLLFETAMLVENPLFLEKHELEDSLVYIFDYSIYKHDWFNFILGKYSKFSNVLKKAIKTYYGDKSSEYQYIDTYLYPEEYFDDYAELLDVDVKSLKTIGELCDSCDMDKENFHFPKEYLENLTKTI